jgi:hypothetical protein
MADQSYLDYDFPGPLQAPPSTSNKLRKGLAWLTRQQRTYNSENVVYVQTNGNRITCRAMLGNKLLKLDDGAGGFRIEVTDLDFLIAAVDLPGIEPVRGDLVIITLGSETKTFEVTPYQGDPCWRYSDPHESMLRIHTKFVAREPYETIDG